MSILRRTDTSVVSRWWWTIDRWVLISLLLLGTMGALMALAASPAVASRIGLDSFYFVRREAAFLILAALILFGFSLLSVRDVRRAATVLFVGFIILTAATFFVGAEYNGARRWLSVAGFALQPSEFLKPAFIVTSAWMMSEQMKSPSFPGYKIAGAMMAVVITLLVLQPDFGQTYLITGAWGLQLFLSGLPMIWFVALGALAASGAVTAYLTVPYFASRIDRFVTPAGGDTYQIDTAINAFQRGGLFGTGPGEGTVKMVLPDAHADYVFAVLGEEYGLIASLALVALFAVIVIRSLALLSRERDHFVFLASAGLVALFGLQVLTNLGVNLNLLPSKGMTLPFISYGGSSLFAMAITMGMLLSLGRGAARHRSRPLLRRPGVGT